jgi:aldose sugar dehydrogenase
LSATRTMVNLPMPAGRFRSAVQGTDGNLYVATDEGSIIMLKPN